MGSKGGVSGEVRLQEKGQGSQKYCDDCSTVMRWYTSRCGRTSCGHVTSVLLRCRHDGKRVLSKNKHFTEPHMKSGLELDAVVDIR